ncbi:hypothetical protein ABC347_09245 [Sphingomonas sp. 1P06PA]|uniref:hypothetical protein n=1 Tax=Sphingomonas sp. 1P06PA TaxID=554121 RepID=UPI0039A4D590
MKASRMQRLVCGVMLIGAVAAPVGAQDFTMSIHDSFSNTRNALATSHIGRLSSPSYRRAPSRRPVAAAPGSVGLFGSAFAGGTAVRAAPAAAAGANLGFASSAATSRQAVNEFVQRVQRKNPQAARELADQLGRHNVSGIYSGIVRPFGLTATNLADVTTAYVILGWMVANQAGNPSPRSVRAVRNQVSALLAQDPQFRSAATRTAVGEEVKVLFVVLHAGMQAATRERSMAQFSDGTRQMFRQIAGEDFRSFTLTPDGFVRRG